MKLFNLESSYFPLFRAHGSKLKHKIGFATKDSEIVYREIEGHDTMKTYFTGLYLFETLNPFILGLYSKVIDNPIWIQDFSKIRDFDLRNRSHYDGLVVLIKLRTTPKIEYDYILDPYAESKYPKS